MTLGDVLVHGHLGTLFWTSGEAELYGGEHGWKKATDLMVAGKQEKEGM